MVVNFIVGFLIDLVRLAECRFYDVNEIERLWRLVCDG